MRETTRLKQNTESLPLKKLSKEDPIPEETYKGISSKQAEKLLLIHGPNSLAEKKKVSAVKMFFEQFTDFMVLILIAATIISAFMGEITEAVTIIAIVMLNSVLGFLQEFRTEKTMSALKQLTAPTAKVIRDGTMDNIPADMIVPGDLLVLEEGDRIPADCRLIQINSMQVDESLLTGESVPVDKSKDSKSDPAGKNSVIYMGTIITRGRGKAIVEATGMNTEMGKIADMIQNIESDETPLQKKLAGLGKFIVFGCIIICAIVSITGIIRGEQLFTMLLSGISLAVAAVPEGLPAIVTIALALGVQKMLKRNALIRKLPAVETLGCASVICSDKTGTLTQNRMTVRKIYTWSEKTRRKEIVEFDSSKIDETARFALEIGGVCNNAVIINSHEEKEKGFKKIKSIFSKHQVQFGGDPTEIALLEAALNAGISENTLNVSYKRIDELPFDSDRKCMSVICELKNGERYVFTKGAPDIILDKCSNINAASEIKKITSAQKNEVMGANDTMASDALRVLGVAFKKLGSGRLNKNEIERDLTFAGLIGMIDPPRKEAKDAVNKCKMAGIKTVMITGDHKITAAAIAKEIGILQEGDMVLTGAELDELGDVGLMKVADKVSVYARVSPKHKLMVVKALKKLGHVVAMTGDGVNDAPAVKEADIGVSMGKTGTDVTKEASAMILMDDNFATIVAAVEEGRVIYNNIRKFIRYMLSCNLGEVLTMFLGMLIGLPIPLLPIQILWVNLVTDGLPAIALGLDPPEREIMKRRPRGAKENIFSNGLLKLILFRGTLIGISTLAVFVSILHFTGSIDDARTASFVTLVITQLIHVFECKSERKNIFEIPLFNNVPLVLSVLCSVIMILGVVYMPVFQGIFKTVPLSFNDWVLILGFSSLGPVLSSFLRLNKEPRMK
ncbi:calcium-translocating P-type ATPase, SERCA-type [Pseudobacteroides cellulosolvens ATCC 35603 = DSM 2933]|uniref:P-type Ca(2+) transporter n=1 Tax=Pseudobacteroides cellulosolvens ATCC 35603 = DSM 2933 TaxID=398512 RepID=A0A0L6JTU0_9FIRM|nr:calcium-translocating P-type ATPase, SERCA-type [Pseudobacteroides cellulosolvens ATCC 35603 = DSM 2933]